MLIDAHDFIAGQTIAGQVCIVGAGAAGITIALALAERGIDVVLCEGGGFDASDESTALYRGTVSGAPTLPSGADDLTTVRLRYFGGSTNHWGGFCAPLRPHDFVERSWLPISGWPLSSETMQPFYDRAADVIGLPYRTFDLAEWGSSGARGTLFDVPGLELSGGQVRPRRFGVDYRSAIIDSRHISLVLHATAIGIDLARNSGRVERVRLASPGGVEFAALATITVLAMGGIENPRLMLASNDVATAGIGNGFDQVGRYFCDHVSTLGGIAALSGRPDEWPDLVTPVIGQVPLPRTVQLAASEQEAFGLPSAGAVFFAEPLKAPRQVGGVRLRDVDRWLQLIGSPAVGSVVPILVAAEQPLDSGSRVLLTRERDRHGVPRVDLHWKQGQGERRAIRQVMRAIGGALGASSRARLQLTLGTLSPSHAASGSEHAADYSIDPLHEDSESYFLEPGNHHMCTTRMSASPRSGVVDADCRVHGTDNLYVAGSSSFATGGVAPPTLTIVALALRLADHISDAIRA